MLEIDKFKALLDDQYNWPAPYLFKFIVPKAQLATLESIVDGNEIKERASSKGKYVSITFSVICNSSDEVLEMYSKVSQIPGILSL